MELTEKASLFQYNTFGIDAIADYFIEYTTVDELRSILKMDLLSRQKVLHIGGGSNLLFLGDYKGVVLHSKILDINLVEESGDEVVVEIGAGVVWDDFVAYSVENGWGGAENLSLIPGEVGAAAVQNIGAYGVEVQDLILSVKAVDVDTYEQRVFGKEECNYGYRDSIFKGQLKGKYIITHVTFSLKKVPVYQLGYQHLETEVLKRGEISLRNIRETIIEVRNAKLPDPKIQGNAGSFFMNPVVVKSVYKNMVVTYPQMPHYFVSEELEKLSAAWLIDQCGWKGKSIGNAGVFEHQALVLVNKGGATGAEIVELATQIQKSVQDKFGILLNPEVNYI